MTISKLLFSKRYRLHAQIVPAVICCILAGCDSTSVSIGHGDVTEHEQTTPEESTPEETTPEESSPEEVTPEETTPEETTPEETTPEETTPEETTPEETTPEETTPEETPVPSAPVNPAQPVGECSVATDAPVDDGSALGDLLTTLHGHLDGSAVLAAEEIEATTAALVPVANLMTNNPGLINQAFEVIDLYDEVFGPLLLNDSTAGSFARNPSGSVDAIHYAVFALQQAVLDHAYAARNVRRFPETLDGRAFLTADFFPGPVSPDAITTNPHTATINASNNPSPSHRPYGAFTSDSRRPTGTYAAPGTIVEVHVPESMVGRGYKVRVGAHSWDLSRKNAITRLDRVSLTFDILCSTTLVSNPLGGGIYIEVPYEADAGAANIDIDNAVRSPFYAARSFTAHTSAEEWTLEKNHTAPWADLEANHFMIQVPSEWLDDIADPAQLMQEWDTSMQSILDLFGITETHKTMLYVQVDTIIRGANFYPGYPMSNFPYRPMTDNATRTGRLLLRGPDELDYVTFHELGHQLFFTKFRGETESAVHLPYVNFLNRVYNVDLDTAFSQSSFRHSDVNLDQSFMNWAVRPNFQQGLPMRATRPSSEKLYQRRGFAHYIIIAKLFGWEALERFWTSEHTDFAAGIDYDRNSDGNGDVDSRILRMSRAAAVDLRPLLHVWGNHPENAETLSTAITTESLPPSAAIYDELQHYKTLIPMTNEAFQTHARIMYPLLQSRSNTEAFEGWYFETAQTWSASDGAASMQALQDIIDLYFPAGRPDGTSAVDPGQGSEPAINAAEDATPPPIVVVEDTIDIDHHTVP